jgi:DNA mismatch endonuclease, patch repair protein
MRRLTLEQKCTMMSRFRKTNSGPELTLRRALERNGLTYQAYPKLPGSPDLVLSRARVAIFVQGCFWHGCPEHYRAPRSRRGYWSAKLAGNKSRDRAAARRLRKMGWHVVTAWECTLKKDPGVVLARIARATKTRSAPTA